MSWIGQNRTAEIIGQEANQTAASSKCFWVVEGDPEDFFNEWTSQIPRPLDAASSNAMPVTYPGED